MSGCPLTLATAVTWNGTVLQLSGKVTSNGKFLLSPLCISNCCEMGTSFSYFLIPDPCYTRVS